MKTKQKVYLFSHDVFECLQLIFRGWWRREEVQIVSNESLNFIKASAQRIFFLKACANRVVLAQDDVVLGEHKGLFYNIHQEAINLTVQFYKDHSHSLKPCENAFNVLYKSQKCEAFLKKQISNRIFSLLKDFHKLRINGSADIEIVMIRNPLNEAVVGHMQKVYDMKIHVTWQRIGLNLLPIGAYSVWLLGQILKRGFCWKSKKQSFQFSRESLHGFHQKTSRDDMMLDYKNFQKKDLLLLEFISKDPRRKRLFKEAQQQGFHTASLYRLPINVALHFGDIFYSYVIFPMGLYVKLLFNQGLYVFNYIINFFAQAFPVEILMSFYDVKYHHSTIDYDDVAMTMVLNKYGAQNVILHWSDLTFFPAQNHAFIAHNIYFVWGDIHYDFHSENYFVDEKVNVGCQYKTDSSDAKEVINNNISFKSFDATVQTVVFFDTSFNDNIQNPNSFYLDYCDVIYKYSISHPQVNVVLKLKNALEDVEKCFLGQNLKIFKELISKLSSLDNFYCPHPSTFDLTDAIAISDVNVSMGMNSPSTVALMSNKEALFYDTTGNTYHPFAKLYYDQIVFDNAEGLYEQINNILSGQFRCFDVIDKELLKDYDAFSDSKALQRMISYFVATKTSHCDELKEDVFCASPGA